MLAVLKLLEHGGWAGAGVSSCLSHDGVFVSFAAGELPLFVRKDLHLGLFLPRFYKDVLHLCLHRNLYPGWADIFLAVGNYEGVCSASVGCLTSLKGYHVSKYTVKEIYLHSTRIREGKMVSYYEPPLKNYLSIDTDKHSITESIELIRKVLVNYGVIK